MTGQACQPDRFGTKANGKRGSTATRREMLLHLLREAGGRGVTTGELLQAGVGSRYGARLLELRQEGYVINSERLREGAWRYTLLDSPASPSSPGSGSQGADQTAAQPGLFDTARMEFDAAVPPTSHYDEAA